MFKEILQIKPVLSPSDLNSMERSLSGRFKRVAKSFGKGLGSILSGGGLLGAAVGMVDKILNPLKETQAAIDRTLKMSDDVVTNAKQFNTTAGKLATLQYAGEATGLDAGTLNTMINKFQVAVAEAKADPEKVTSVRNFTNQDDAVQGFYEFMQSLRNMGSSDQSLVQKEVFGEKLILKSADFAQSIGPELLSKIGGPSSAKLTKRFDQGANLNDLKDLMAARLQKTDDFAKLGKINEGMVRSQNSQLAKEKEAENINITGYKNLANISEAVSDMGNVVKQIAVSVTGAVTSFYDISATMKKISESAALRGILKLIKAD